MEGVRERARVSYRILLALCCFAVPLAGNGIAEAAPSSITPVLECVVVSPSGEYIAVMGYENLSSTSITVRHGSSNKLVPSKYDGNQPMTFLPGRHHGVFSVTVTNATPRWKLLGKSLVVSRNATPCPPSTEMPEQGNGTGIVVGLLMGGVIGGLMIRRLQRRLSGDPVTASPSTLLTGPEADDA